MSLTIVIWLGLFIALTVLAFLRPAWGVAVYMLTVFLCPPFWWWGGPIAGVRWNFYSGWILLAAILISGHVGSARQKDTNTARWIPRLALAGLANATFVHLVLADNWAVSSGPYMEFAKFTLLFLMITAAVRDKTDYRIIVWAILLGAAYIGYEVTVNDRGRLVGNRLEGVGIPCASSANGLASLIVTVLPLTGPILLTGQRWEKLLVLPVAPLIVNVLLLCNSRGAFLAAIGSAVVMLVAAPAGVRRKAFKIVVLGCVAVWFLLGDPRIVERFMTTFRDQDHRDNSAQSRLVYWEAGLRMLADYPLGSGGDGFHNVHGPRYIKQAGGGEFAARSVHNGFINSACDWGAQGAMVKIGFFMMCMALLWQTMRYSRAIGDEYGMLLAGGLMAGLVAFLLTSLFGDHLDNEWGFWIPALAIGHARLYGAHNRGDAQPRKQPPSNAKLTRVSRRLMTVQASGGYARRW